jgi:hypothetical protein
MYFCDSRLCSQDASCYVTMSRDIIRLCKIQNAPYRQLVSFVGYSDLAATIPYLLVLEDYWIVIVARLSVAVRYAQEIFALLTTASLLHSQRASSFRSTNFSTCWTLPDLESVSCRHTVSETKLRQIEWWQRCQPPHSTTSVIRGSS